MPIGEDFAAALEDRSVGVARDYSSDTRVVFVAFGGMAGGLGMPPFEFLRQTESLPVSRLFVRDVSQCWYHNGVPGLGDAIPAVADALRAEHESLRATRVVYTGHSAGGYAALLFGTLVGADAVVAFSPQTFLGRRERLRYFDWRFRREVAGLRISNNSGTTYLDLLHILKHQGKPSIQIHYSNGNRLDRLHSERLRCFDTVTLSGHEHEGHNVVRVLRDSGDLQAILKAVLGLPGHS